MTPNEERERFARDLRAAAKRTGVEDSHYPYKGITAFLNCTTTYGPRRWLEAVNLPGRKYGQRVLDIFGLDSRDYGGNWNQGKR